MFDEKKGAQMARLMQVRQVARTLGVHENTVRRWEERGLLHAVRLPSGVRRFRPDDVEAVRKQMFSGFAPTRTDDDIAQVRARSID
jgi:excisionase family DNA binding protein